ncbi:cytochrome P450 [Zopfia rhizophila CBS 207.26]|uniref:Cytochrome P450 n=1 Tax=Zopfia rhizophila CBS 207.26 TaxID=1314779 RepID=A0A6A6DA43_9PEZI|nr:cytochrome P450 [Zopfia rhizophila CBS 207.26]
MRQNEHEFLTFEQVVHPDGIHLANNVHVPQGTLLAIAMQPVQVDEAIYPDAHRFNAFRFTQPGAVRNIMDPITPKENTERQGEQKQKSTVTLDDSFLGFGFGKHTCPGRFFALNEMKIYVAYMLQNYEIEYLKERPKSADIIWLKLPLNGATVRVRRRVKPV